MKISIQLFAGLKDAVGESEMDMDIASGATVSDLWSQLETAHPEIESYRGRVAFAVDELLADAGATLTDGNQVAILPPVSGG